MSYEQQRQPMYHTMPNGVPPQMDPRINANGAQQFYPPTGANLPHMPPPVASNLAPTPVVQKMAPHVNLVNGSGATSRTASPAFGGIPASQLPPTAQQPPTSQKPPTTQQPPTVQQPPTSQLPPTSNAWNAQRPPLSAPSVTSQSTFSSNNINNNVTTRAPPASAFAPLKTSTPNQSFNLAAGVQNITLNSNYASPQQPTPATPARPAYPAQPFNGQPQQPLQYQNQQYPTQQQQMQHQQKMQQQQMQQHPMQHQQMQHQQMQQMQHQQMQQMQQPHPFINNVLSATHSGFNRLWGNETVDLLENRHILPPGKIQPPPIRINQQLQESVNCSPDIFRCTLAKVPETKELLNKTRLPLGILIHPFRDLSNLPVIQCSTIVRCRACRTYINPFVLFVDSKKWKCNLCYRVNELPDEFQYDPVSKTYGDVTRRPEVRSSTIEFIAPSEYMLRPPQPAIYLFLLDVSNIAVQSGYLNTVCDTLMEHLDNLPGDVRTQVGFITFSSTVNFYHLADGFNQPHEITVLDIDDVFLPCPDNLLVNLKECRDLIKDLLTQLPKRFANVHEPKSALGAALQAAFKMMSSSGGRVTVFQACLPNYGPGALQSREDPNNRSSKEVNHLGPATDFYKRLALECSGQQIAVDLFLMNSQYSDLATLSGISKFSGGCIHHFPLFNHGKAQQVEFFKRCFERYLTRKIGFEAVMRVRCTRGLAIHTFHGNFFVRSTDLLSLPNINPDAGFGMQIVHEESLSDLRSVCFQAALLYTSSKGERRIRVHTLCLPVASSLTEILYAADVQCMVGLLVKMAVDRSLTAAVSDARDALINATVDVLCAFKVAQNLPSAIAGQVVAPQNLALLPLYISAILKHPAFRVGTSTRLDDRVFSMCEMKTLPLDQLMRYIYPDFYNIDCLFENPTEKVEPSRMHLSAERLDSRSIFLLDCGMQILIFVGTNAQPKLINSVFGVPSTNDIPDLCFTLQNTGTPESEALNAFIESLNEEKPFAASIQIIRDSSSYRSQFTEKLIDDRTDNSLSYYEFLQHLRCQVK
ncbi:protein transport protein Sec24B [Lutzomyia longipalpis]|uniref:protein transport protein Sec24B n=1 Tax=Lutzomyia longipalpis TaxID=7200 RepID=UPI002483CFB8|nr:protein transport protein Sec24B [Lutzomyia longipalpis]XP_055689104.1 protein transport protein Sec24B [Lutzomyia longipalpis]